MSEDNRNGTIESSDSEDTRSDGTGVTRRRMIVAGAATWASVGFAGCVEISGDDCEEETTEDGGGGGGGGGQQTTQDGQQPNTTVTSSTTTTGDTGSGDGSTGTTTSCSPRAEFLPGMEIGVLIDVFNSVDASFAGTDAVESVTLSFPDRDIEPQELSWTGSHETHSEKSWGSTVETPPDADKGTYRYEVTVEPKADADLDKTTVTDSFTIV